MMPQPTLSHKTPCLPTSKRLAWPAAPAPAARTRATGRLGEPSFASVLGNVDGSVRILGDRSP